MQHGDRGEITGGKEIINGQMDEYENEDRVDGLINKFILV